MSPILFLNHCYMINSEIVKAIISEELERRKLFPVEVSVTPTGKISVFIDSMNGVTIADCAAISRFIDARLNRNEQDYELEVSSPGPDKSLLLPVQYRKHIGREIDILKKNGIRHRGRLKCFTGNLIIIEAEQKIRDEKSGKQKTVTGTIEIEFEQIKKAKVIVR